MFEPETEDMLPRQAPKPSAIQMTAKAAGPEVPEVSILFGQQQQATPTTMPPSQEKPTYAAWKKQVLPRVTFPPVGSEVTGIMGCNSTVATSRAITSTEYTRSSIYPLRTATAAISPLVATSTATSALQYRRSLESAPTITYATTPAQEQFVAGQQLQQQQRRSIEAMPQCNTPRSREDVLTICAGTQTDASLSPVVTGEGVLLQAMQAFATRQDLELVHATVQQMREEQLRLMQICEALLIGQQQQQAMQGHAVREVGIQCDNVGINQNGIAARQNPQRATPIMHEHIPEEEEVNENVQPTNNYNPPQPAPYQSPRLPPTAQSTAYRPNTPRNMNRSPLVQQQPQQNIATVLPKPATEKSMVMNELALKYLPNEKLNQLLQELNISPRSTPAHALETAKALCYKENVEKGPSDISNASYKYLKKYRLLPEEQELPAENGLQQHSPYQRAQSPRFVGTPIMAAQEQLLDLEHIRRQPKFL